MCALDGVVAQWRWGLEFRGAQVDEACAERVQALVRQRVLGLFERRGILSSGTVAEMQGWGHSGGYSVLRACGSHRRIDQGATWQVWLRE